MTALLRGFWYLARPGRDLARGQLVGMSLLGDPVVVGRRHDGAVFALRNICPHRGIPLHHGRIVGHDVECCYHGWLFGTETGRCSGIPSLTPDQQLHVDRIGVTAYPCREVQGNVWVFMPEGTDVPPDDHLPAVPRAPDMGDRAPQVSLAMDFACDVDHAVVGLMDPTHLGYVHTSWWWQKRSRQPRVKEKSYVATELGFQLERHELKQGGRPYRILGRNVTTQITFELPGVRIEHIKGDRYSVVALTAITPVTEATTIVNQFVYWTIPFLGMFRPIVQRMARTFLGQDRDVVIKQEEGLAYDPPLILIDDADTQAKWYYRLKQHYLQCRRDGVPFTNPIKARMLRYRS